MGFFETNHSFSYPWPLLTFANWKKYPNEHSTHVVSVDVLTRSVDPVTGALETERLLRCKQPVPSIFRSLGFKVDDEAYFLESSVLDPLTQVYTARTVNLSYRSLFVAKETCVFKPDPDNPLNHTRFSQRAEIKTIGALSFFSRLIEDAAVCRFRANAVKGRQALESVLNSIAAEAAPVDPMS